MIALEPSQVTGYSTLGYVYQQLGGDQDAERWYRKGLQIDPGFGGAYYGLAKVALYRGDRQAALAWADSLAAAQANLSAGEIRFLLGDLAGAKRLLENRRLGSAQVPFPAYIAQREGDMARAQVLLDSVEIRAHELVARGDQVRYPPRLFASIHAMRGQPSEAIRWLNTWHERGGRDPRNLTMHPIFSSLRNDPGFVELIRRMEARQAEQRERAKREGWW